jgi:hypothetical protein
VSAWSHLAGRSYRAVRVPDLGTSADRAGLARSTSGGEWGANAIWINGIDKDQFGSVWRVALLRVVTRWS